MTKFREYELGVFFYKKFYRKFTINVRTLQKRHFKNKLEVGGGWDFIALWFYSFVESVKHGREDMNLLSRSPLTKYSSCSF